MAVGVRQAQKGAFCSESTAAVERLFEQYSGRIHLFCRHVLRHPADAEDAVQTTFLYAQRALLRGVVPENEYAWLHTIAKNVCRSQYRSAARRSAVTGVDLDALPGPDRSEDDRRELLGSLGEALSSLPEAQRRAIEITQRPALSLNFGPLLLKLKGMFVGSAAEAATTLTVVVGVVVGGVALDRAVVDREARAPVLEGPAGSSMVAADPLGGRASVRPMTSSVGSPTSHAQNLVRRAGAARHSGARSRADAPPAEVPGVVPTALPVPDPEAPTPATPDRERIGDPTKTVVDAPATVGTLVGDLTDQLPIPGVGLPPLPVDPPVGGGDGHLGDVLPDAPAPPLGLPSLP